MSWATPTRIALAKGIIGTIVAFDLLALAAFSFTSTETTKTITAGSTAPVVTPDQAVPEGTDDLLASLGEGTPLGGGTSTSLGQTPTTDPKDEEPGKEEEPDVEGDVEIAKCPIDIGEPATKGGLQSLISFAPAFGPFKDEAFALAAVYQPALQLLGPILGQYPKLAPQLAPAVDPFVAAFGGLLDQGFALVGPLYKPYRNQVLAAEAELAKAIAPITQKLAASPLGGCIVALEAALLNDLKKA